MLQHRESVYKQPKIILVFLSIVVLTFLVYLSVLDNGFVNWDDGEYIIDNVLIRELSWRGIKTIFTTFQLSNYHPLVLLSYQIEYHFFKLNPFIYHLDNLILHTGNSLLVFYLIYLLSESLTVSFITALLFGIHPLHVESVAWATERKDVLSTFFYLGAGISYLIYKRGGSGRYYFIALLAFLLSLLSKAMAVSLPFVLLLLDYHLGNRFNKKTLIEKVPFFMLSIIFGIVNIIAQGAGGALGSSRKYAVLHNIMTGFKGIVFYLIKTICPVNLSAHYPYPRFEGVLSLTGVVDIGVVLMLVAVIIYTRHRTKVLVFGASFFLVTILPVLKFIPFGNAFAADRYMYIPSIGLFYMFGVLGERVYGGDGLYRGIRKILVVIVVGVVVMFFSVLTYRRGDVWQDSEPLWKDTIKKSPESYVAYDKLGEAYYEKGDIEKAIANYKKAISLNPHDDIFQYNLGVAYQEKGLYDLAISQYRKALNIKPDDYKSYYNLGIIYYKKGDVERAIASYKKAVSINPAFLDAQYNLGLLYQREGLFDLAITQYEKTLKIKPDDFDTINNLGVVYYKKGLFDKAVRYFRRALKIRHNDSEVYYSLGLAYYEKGLMDSAIDSYKNALKFLTNQAGKDELRDLYTDLGNAYFKKGFYKEALGSYKKALSIDPDDTISLHNMEIIEDILSGGRQ